MDFRPIDPAGASRSPLSRWTPGNRRRSSATGGIVQIRMASKAK